MKLLLQQLMLSQLGIKSSMTLEMSLKNFMWPAEVAPITLTASSTHRSLSLMNSEPAETQGQDLFFQLMKSYPTLKKFLTR